MKKLELVNQNLRDLLESCVEIKDLDVNLGLMRLNNDKKLYINLLQKLVNNKNFIIEELRKAIDREDFSAVNRMIHSMKGLFGMLGNTKLLNLASEIEQDISLKSPDLNYVNKRYKFISETIILIDQIEFKLTNMKVASQSQSVNENRSNENRPNKNRLSVKKSNEIIESLITFLNEYDPEAMQIFEENLDLFKYVLGQDFYHVSSLIYNYEIEDALIICKAGTYRRRD